MYEVLWLDSTVDTHDYESVEELRKSKRYVCERVTVGYYAFEDSEYFVMVEDISFDDKGEVSMVSGLLSIPKGMIKRRRLLK